MTSDLQRPEPFHTVLMARFTPYYEWPSKVEGLGVLHLDPRNSRLGKRNYKYTQAEIAEELLRNSDVQEIATSIARDGYFPMEQMVGYIDSGDGLKYIVEGNRRLLACKLIKEPRKAPIEYRRFFERLAKRADVRQIVRVRVLWAPNRESAWKMIVRKHTKSTMKDWKPIMQANFYLQPLEEGYSIAEASELLGVTESDIRSARFATQLYTAAQELEMAENLKERVSNPYKFELSTLMRFVDKKEGKAFLGVEADPEGNAMLKTSPSNFKKRFDKVVTDISRDGGESSRTLNSSEDVRRYIKERTGLSSIAPTNKNGSSPLLIQPLAIEPAADTSGPVQPAANRKGGGERTPIGLFLFSSIQIQHVHARIRAIAKELSEISPSRHPNASALLLRTFLELSTYAFLKDSGELDRWKGEKISKGEPKSRVTYWVPEFREMINRIINEHLLSDAQLIRSLGLYINDKHTSAPLFYHMNQFVHNGNWHPSEERLRFIWNEMAAYARAVNAR